MQGKGLADWGKLLSLSLTGPELTLQQDLGLRLSVFQQSSPGERSGCEH